MSRIGDIIREERLKKGFSPKQIGRKCGVSESFILDVESGKKIINEKLLEKLSKLLGKNLEESVTLEPVEKEEIIQKPKLKVQAPQRRQTVTPLDQWSDALSGIIKKVPIYDITMKSSKGYKSFPIINKKVEGFSPEKLIYVEAPDDTLNGFRICREDKILIYLNQELVNNSFSLVEYEGKRQLRKIKRIEGNKIEIISYHKDKKSIVKSIRDVKIIGRGIRLEVELNK
ncbi:helix-turn-helix domain-containing protein [Crassaminicella profunda]|uniref:helix-turn-helix domain-containing protein n=1 Tax=Crassaminicella profunda TaxID=1286698 RepID=UPI001CA77F28|nr:helix-turn-helix transcriptional regulator [Crassaminicella profunda]QZY54768.1 helix-turn-helix domain-containing protein [Crassaminicella profunda]